MPWDALAAIGSVAGALVFLVGSIAAVIQIKHLRVASQLDCYFELMEKLHSPEIVERRKYIQTIDLTDSQALKQYLAYRRPHDPTIAKVLEEYPKDFIAAAGFANITAAPVVTGGTSRPSCRHFFV